MSKKDKMLNYIENKVKWFLYTDASVEIIPYYNLSRAMFSRAKEYLVSGCVDEDDVVCLVSTSILEPGKSGILFTTDAMYCKSWGLLTTKYRNYYSRYDFAKFDFHNDFYEDRMKELMKNLNDISIEEDENEQRAQKIDKIIDIGKKAGTAALGGMVLLDILSSISDDVVNQNNNKIANEIAKLENSEDPETVSAISIYKEFIPLMNKFADACENAENEGENIRKETHCAMITGIYELLSELLSQISNNTDISPDDEEEYSRYNKWLFFWTLMFYDKDLFREAYPIDLLEEMPECWDAIIGFMDGLIEEMDGLVEDVWEESFSNEVYGFANTVINNSSEILDLVSDSDWDEETIERLGEMIESNNQAVKTLANVLEKATDFLQELLCLIKE